MFTKLRIAFKDKKIKKLLFKSKWFQENRYKDKSSVSILEIDRKEQWVIEVDKFVNFILGIKKYKVLINQYNLSKNDLIDFFLLMTIATFPNPIFKSGPSKLSNTLVGTAMYQELESQFKRFLFTLGRYDNRDDIIKYGHKHGTDVIMFANFIKDAHDTAYGEVTIEETMVTKDINKL